MGGGGGSSTTSTSATYDNKSYVYQGGAVDLSNLLGTLNYKSSGSSFDFNQDKVAVSKDRCELARLRYEWCLSFRKNGMK